jgi:Mrp family chromosome partitioning ATPase
VEPLDLRELLRPIRRWWWMIVLVVAAVTAATYLYYSSQPKVYTASTEVLIRPTESDPGFNTGTPDRVGQNLIRILQSSGVVEQVVRSSGVSGGVSASLSETSDFIIVTAQADSAVGAAKLANAYADALLVSRRRGLRQETEETLRAAQKELAELPPGPDSELTRTTLLAKIQGLEAASALPPTGAERIDRALPPGAATEPQPEKNARYAFFLSLLLSVAAAYGLERLDRRLKRLDEVERAFGGLPLLGAIPHGKPRRDGVTVGTSDEVLFREAFRTIHTNLAFSNLDRPPRTILVTSALPGEGKSTFVQNLAMAYRDSGLRVAVVESDLRQPTLATMFRVQAGPGLTNVLSGAAELAETVQTVETLPAVTSTSSGNGTSTPDQPGSISVLTSGPAPVNPPVVLATERFRSLFDEIASEYDITIVDSAPLLAVSDSVPLLSRVDGIILVCRLGKATYDSVKQVKSLMLRHPDANVLGVVANDVPLKAFGGRYADYYNSAAA